VKDPMEGMVAIEIVVDERKAKAQASAPRTKSRGGTQRKGQASARRVQASYLEQVAHPIEGVTQR